MRLESFRSEPGRPASAPPPSPSKRETAQWQQADAGQYRIVLDTGTQLGMIWKILVARFNRPGTYRYHLDQSRDANGTIIVVGTTRPGPAIEITEIPDTRG
jgi:hypothetical protein